VENDAPDELVETLRLVPDHIEESQLPNSGYVIHTLQTALYDALSADSAEDAIVRSTAAATQTRSVLLPARSPAHASGANRFLTGG